MPFTRLPEERNIALVDTILYYREKAESTYRLLDYRRASIYYEKVVELNPYDTYASNRYTNCISKFTTECDATFRQAEYYSNEKQYTKALELFQRIIDSECPAKVQAVEQVNKLNLILNQRKNHSRVLTYEYAKDVPVGFSYGKYNMHKSGGFFGMSLNGAEPWTGLVPSCRRMREVFLLCHPTHISVPLCDGLQPQGFHRDTAHWNRCWCKFLT